MCVLAQSGCGQSSQSPTTESSANTSQPRTVTANLPPASEQPGSKRQKTSSPLREVSLWETNSAAPSKPSPRTGPPAGTSASMSTMTGSASVAQGLLTRLAHLNFSGGKISADQANEVNQLLQQLREQGAAALPAIREYLQQNQDFGFDDFAGGNLVNYGTLRLGLMDALQQIGGAEAIQLSVATLQQTADPLEIALLSSYLESQQPGQFRQFELAAAQEALTQAANGQVPGRDMSPLFELLQAYGSTNTSQCANDPDTFRTRPFANPSFCRHASPFVLQSLSCGVQRAAASPEGLCVNPRAQSATVCAFPQLRNNSG